MKTKIKFSDIAGMLKRDEMREIIGGCGNSYASGSSSNYGGGGGYSSLNGFGGGTAIGSTFGGVPYSGYSNPVVNNFNSSSTSSSSSNQSVSGSITSTVSSWHTTTNGITTNNPTDISRLIAYLGYQNNVQNKNPNASQISSFINNEMTVGGRATNDTIYGGWLHEVIVINNFHANPYKDFMTVSNVAGVLQDVGNSLSVKGYVLTASVVGAEVGVPMAAIGNIISTLGTGLESGQALYNVYQGNNTQQNLTKISQSLAFYIIGEYIDKKFTNGFLDLTPYQLNMIKQTLGIELTVIEKSYKTSNYNRQ